MARPQQICRDLAKGNSTASAIALRMQLAEAKVVEELNELALTGHVSNFTYWLEHNDPKKPLIITIWKLEKPLN